MKTHNENRGHSPLIFGHLSISSHVVGQYHRLRDACFQLPLYPREQRPMKLSFHNEMVTAANIVSGFQTIQGSQLCTDCWQLLFKSFQTAMVVNQLRQSLHWGGEDICMHRSDSESAQYRRNIDVCRQFSAVLVLFIWSRSLHMLSRKRPYR